MIKRYAIKPISLFCLLLFLSISGTSQVAYHNFSSNDGLPSNEVYCVHQDREGFLWFGTDHGVVKYNGYNFKTFTTADGLTDNTVLSMKEDDSGNLWFLTLTGGICYFDGRKIAPHPLNDTIKQLCTRRIPTSYEVMPNKQIWLGFVEMGIAKIDTNRAQFFPFKKSATANDGDSTRIYVFHLTRERYFYTSIQSPEPPKINDPDIKSINVYTVSHIYVKLNFNLLALDSQKIFMSLENYILYINAYGNQYQYCLPKNNIVLKLQKSDEGKVWILQKNNACYGWKFDNDKIIATDSIVFANNISNFLLDRQGNQWITTLDQGIYMVPNTKIRTFTKLKLPGSYKLSSINNNETNLYVGLPEGKLLKVDKNLNPTIYPTSRAGRGPTAAASITFKLNGDPLTNLDTSFYWMQYIDNFYTKILQLDEDKFLIGSPSGLVLLSNKKRILFNSQKQGFSKRVCEICKLSPQKFLIGTYNGLYYFEPEKGNSLTEEPFFKNIRITSAKVFKQTVFAVATRGKGIALNIKGKYYSITESQGLISNLAEDLYFENDSVLWEASFKGISKVSFHLVKDSLHTLVRNYTKEDGLCSNQVNGVTGFNGLIWLATNEGLCYFNPKDLTEDTTEVPLYFSNISVNGIKRSPDSLQLSHDENSIYIEFNALYYKAIQGIRYKVRLKGIAPWKFTNLNYIQYYNLPPGNYQFEVAAEDKEGKYRSHIHTLHFVIKPRFIDTLLFKVIIGFMLLLIAGVIMPSIFSYQKLKATNVIKLLQAEFKALSYQINPHFIFNVLNSIQYYILKKDTDNAVHLLGSFSLLIRRIVNNSRQQYIGIIEEVECLREYMDLEKMRLDNKFEYSINIDSSIDIEDKNILPMIIQPLVENSIWHGIVPSSKPGIISIDFKKENSTVICKVEDNGVGINTKAANKEKSQNNLSLAMKNVSERLKIISELNDSTWAIKTEDKSVTDPLQSGTIVIIVFPAVKK